MSITYISAFKTTEKIDNHYLQKNTVRWSTKMFSLSSWCAHDSCNIKHSPSFKYIYVINYIITHGNTKSTYRISIYGQKKLGI
jgi:hypothetical protein